MATAKHPNFGNSSIPNIDVYTTTVVVYEGETFDWTVSGQDGVSGVSVTKSSATWPFSATSLVLRSAMARPPLYFRTPQDNISSNAPRPRQPRPKL